MIGKIIIRRNKIQIIGFLLFSTFILLFAIKNIFSGNESHNNKEGLWELTFNKTDVILSHKSDDDKIHISIIESIDENNAIKKKDIYPYEFTSIDEYFSFSTKGLYRRKIKGFVSNNGFILDISSDTVCTDSICVLLEIHTQQQNNLLFNTTGNQILFSEKTLQVNGRVSSAKDYPSFKISGNSSVKIQSIPLKSRKLESFYSLEKRYPKLITIGNTNISFQNSLFSDIEWLNYVNRNNVSDINYIRDTFGNVLINPDYFRLFFLSCKADYVTNSKYFLMNALKDIEKKPELILPLTAKMAQNIYDESKDLHFLNEIYKNLVIMNQRWDSLLVLEQKYYNERILLKMKGNHHIFGLPALFYFSLYQRDCKSLTIISELLNNKANANHFRNKSLMYSMYINGIDLDSIKDNPYKHLFVPFYADSNPILEIESMEENIFDYNPSTPGSREIKFPDAINEHYKLISLLLSYHFLRNASDNN